MIPKKPKLKENERGSDSYCLEILDWVLPYSFSLDKNKHFGDAPFSEHLALELRGKMINPGKFLGEEVRVVILGDRAEEDALRNPDKPVAIEPRCLGVITLRGQQREYLGFMPFDATVRAGNFLALGHYRYLVLSGQALFKGKADITSLHFFREFVSEDWF